MMSQLPSDRSIGPAKREIVEALKKDGGWVVCKIACNIDPLRGAFASNSDPL